MKDVSTGLRGAARCLLIAVLATLLGTAGGLTWATTASADEPPALEVTVTVDSATTDPVTGATTVTGTVTCSYPITATAKLLGSVTQDRGPRQARGDFITFASCLDTPTTWSTSLDVVSGRFRPGRATVDVTALACDPVSGVCSDDSVNAVIRLAV